VPGFALKAIANPAWLRLLSILAASKGHEACVRNLTEPVGLSQPTVSHYLKVLTDAGFLGRSKRGTWAYYALVPGALDPSPRCSSPHEFRFATHRCQVFRVVFRRN
jgi:ArsR family transcriptional regulator